MATNTASNRARRENKVPSALLLETYIAQKYSGDPLQLSKASGVPTSQIKRWLSKNAIVSAGSVFLRASKFPEETGVRAQRLEGLKTGISCIELNKHIDNEFAGVQSSFAKTHAVHQQQVNRWGNIECLFISGQVYRKQRELNASSTISAKAA